MTEPICAAVVLNYNGRHLLQENLASVVSAARKVEGGCDVIVLDNQSADDSVEFVRKNCPGVRVEVAPSNRILFSYNDLCRRIRHQYVILLNNDIRVREDSLAVLLPPCAAPDVLAVCAILYDGDGKEITRYRTLAATHRGIFRTAFAQADTLMPTMDAGGGCAVFDRMRFLALGGFDELYWPYYYEDTDLSYGAWKRGLRVLVEPRSIMYHRHAATIQHNRQNEIVCHRNACLFIWKNITDPVLLAKHFAWLAFLVPWRALRGNWPYARGIWTALRKLPQALKRRREMKPLWKYTDAEVWALVRGNGPSTPLGAVEASVKRQPANVASLPS